MPDSTIDPTEDYLNALFKTAKQNGVQYLYTLIRISGVGSYTKDPFFEIADKIENLVKNIESQNKEELLLKFKEYFSNIEINSLLKNLLSCAHELDYKQYPFEINYAQSRSPEYEENKKFIKEILDAQQLPNYENFLKNIYQYFIDKKDSDLDSAEESELRVEIKKLLDFLNAFVKKYKQILSKFKEPEIVKLAKFTTIECLSGEDGLCRLNFYHSNGSTSFYERTKTGTSGLNIMCSFPPKDNVMIFTGVDPLKPIWMYKNKPLYEKGAYGRYNSVGEFKPLIYPGDSTLISKTAYDLSKDIKDQRVHGCVFYIMVTCHHIIEFIVKTNFEIPNDYIAFSSTGIGRIVLSKIEIKDSPNKEINNMCFYDCSLELEEFSTECIINGLQFIDVSLYRIAFRLDSKIEWFLKYPYVDTDSSSKLNLSEKNMEVLEDFLVKKIDKKYSSIFDIAISWYINGKNSKNIFTEFLSYCIAIESLVDPFLGEDLESSKKFTIPDEMSEDKILEYINKSHDDLYSKNPTEFIKDSYFNGIQGISRRLKLAMSLVFGEKHQYVGIFFKKNKGTSMYDLRSRLAHGSYTILDSEHREKIQDNIGNIQEIAYDFIMRLIYDLTPEEKIVDVNPSRSVTIPMGNNPRACGVASSLDMFSNKDWKIRAEWIL